MQTNSKQLSDLIEQLSSIAGLLRGELAATTQRSRENLSDHISRICQAMTTIAREIDLDEAIARMPSGRIKEAAPYDPTRLEEWRTTKPQPGKIAELRPDHSVEDQNSNAAQPDRDELQNGPMTRIDISQAFKATAAETVGASEFIRTAQTRAQVADALLEQQRCDDADAALAYEKARTDRAEREAKRNELANEPDVRNLVRAARTSKQLIASIQDTQDIDLMASLALGQLGSDLLAALQPFTPNGLEASGEATPPDRA